MSDMPEKIWYSTGPTGGVHYHDPQGMWDATKYTRADKAQEVINELAGALRHIGQYEVIGAVQRKRIKETLERNKQWIGEG